jgi:uncharacterized membrane protein
MNKMKTFVLAVIIFGVLEVASLFLGVFSSLSYGESFRVVFGSVFVLFLPGWVWSFVFFDDKGEKKIDVIERIALSFALSIAVVPLAVFYLNLVGMKISAWSSFFVVLVLILVGLGIVIWRKR